MLSLVLEGLVVEYNIIFEVVQSCDYNCFSSNRLMLDTFDNSFILINNIENRFGFKIFETKCSFTF